MSMKLCRCPETDLTVAANLVGFSCVGVHDDDRTHFFVLSWAIPRVGGTKGGGSGGDGPAERPLHNVTLISPTLSSFSATRLTSASLSVVSYPI